MAAKKLSMSRLAAEVAVAEIQAKFEGRALIRLGRDLDPLIHRIPTGSFGLDWGTGGGWPRGRMTELIGPESSGKTTEALHACRRVIEQGGRALWVPIEDFDWAYAVALGVPVDSRSFGMAESEEGNVSLDMVIEAIRSGEWDVVVIDSLAMLRNYEYNVDKDGEYKKGVGERTRGGETLMLSEFMARLFSAFIQNTRFQYIWDRATKLIADAADRKGKEDKAVTAAKLITAKPRPRQPAVLAINQLRDQGLANGMPAAPKPPGGRAIRHGKSVGIEFGTSELIWGTTNAAGKLELVKKTDKEEEKPKNPVLLARRVHWKVGKNKCGVPYRSGTFLLGQSNQMHFRVGQIDNVEELVYFARRFNVIEQSGSWFVLGEQKFQGEGKLIEAIRSSTDLQVALQAATEERMAAQMAVATEPVTELDEGPQVDAVLS